MSIEAALVAIRRGKVVGVPTDTVYGVAVDPRQCRSGPSAVLAERSG